MIVYEIISFRKGYLKPHNDLQTNTLLNESNYLKLDDFIFVVGRVVVT